MFRCLQPTPALIPLWKSIVLNCITLIGVAFIDGLVLQPTVPCGFIEHIKPVDDRHTVNELVQLKQFVQKTVELKGAVMMKCP